MRKIKILFSVIVLFTNLQQGLAQTKKIADIMAHYQATPINQRFTILD